MNRKQLSEFIKNLRTSHGATQMDVAKKTKISQGKISKVEAGKLDLSIDEFCRVIKVFGLRLEIGVIENE